MTQEEQLLWQEIDDNWRDNLPVLSLADWLDKRGDRRGECLRYMVEYNVTPIKLAADVDTWTWPRTRKTRMPRAVNDRLNRRSSHARPSEAYQIYCNAWLKAIEDGCYPFKDLHENV